MKFQLSYRRKWMLTGFAAAFFIGDLFLAVRGASAKSIEPSSRHTFFARTPAP